MSDTELQVTVIDLRHAPMYRLRPATNSMNGMEPLQHSGERSQWQLSGFWRADLPAVL
jgi:hypothetical protein